MIATCRRRSRAGLHGAEGSAHHADDQGRTARDRRDPILDAPPAELARVLDGTSGTTILLAHDPRRLIEAAALDVQLVLSGHTHGGQVLLPGVGAIAGRKFPVLAGTGREDNATVFVSRGVGTVYVPVRINCPPDVSVLTLRSAAEAAEDVSRLDGPKRRPSIRQPSAKHHGNRARDRGDAPPPGCALPTTRRCPRAARHR